MIQPFIGRLGNGGEDDSDTPQQVPLPAKQQIESVVAGPDCTFLIASSGKVLACGNNEHNKLGLNSEVRGVAKRRAKVTYYIITAKKSGYTACVGISLF